MSLRQRERENVYNVDLIHVVFRYRSTLLITARLPVFDKCFASGRLADRVAIRHRSASQTLAKTGKDFEAIMLFVTLGLLLGGAGLLWCLVLALTSADGESLAGERFDRRLSPSSVSDQTAGRVRLASEFVRE
jgi:hypothetical protein